MRPAHEGSGRPERVETVGVDADGQIGVERDRGAGRAELLRRHPLCVQVVPEGRLGVRALRAREHHGAGPVAEPVARRPEAGVGQQLGVGVDPGAERIAARRPRRQQRFGHGSQDLATQVQDRLVVHQCRSVRRRDLAPEFVVPEQPACLGRRGELRQQGRIDEDLVVGQATHGEIGARVGRRIQEGGVQRQGAQHRRAHLLDPVPELGHVRVAADAPVLLGAQGVQREEQTPATGRGGAAGGGDQQRRRLRAGPFHHDPVVPRRNRLRPTLVEAETVAVDRLRPDLAHRLHPTDAGRQALAVHPAVLQCQGAPHVTRMDPAGQRHLGRGGPPDAVHQDGLERSARLDPPALAQGVGDIGPRGDRSPEGRQDGHDDRVLGPMHPPVGADEGDLHAVTSGQLRQRGPRRGRWPHRGVSRMSKIPRAGMSTHSGRLFASYPSS